MFDGIVFPEYTRIVTIVAISRVRCDQNVAEVIDDGNEAAISGASQLALVRESPDLASAWS